MRQGKRKESSALKETAVEMKQQFTSDVKGAFSFKRAVSLRRLIPCAECEGTGKNVCMTCDGTGEQKLVWNDETKVCEACDGLKEVFCWNCEGRKYTSNKNRKYVLATVTVGMLGWGYIMYLIFGPHLLPEQQAKYLAGGGGGGSATTQIRAKSATEKPAQQMGQGRRFAPGGGVATPGGGTISPSGDTSPR